MDHLSDFLDELRVDAMLVLVPGFQYNFARSNYGARQLNWTSEMLPLEDADPLMEDDAAPCTLEVRAPGNGSTEGDTAPLVAVAGAGPALPAGRLPSQPKKRARGGKQSYSANKKRASAHQPPPPRPAGQLPRPVTHAAGRAPTLTAPRSGRVRKAPGRFGHGGELEGRAGAYRSAPLPTRNREATLGLEAPGFCLPGCTIWARGWLSGGRTWFKARILKLRRQRPPIHVVYFEDAQGNVNPLALPNLKEAYVHASDVAQLTG